MKDTLHSAIVKLLRPLMRILIKQRMSFSTFIDLAKWVYIDEASVYDVPEGKRQTTSRISTISGIRRKEVAALREEDSPYKFDHKEKHNRAARVISGWIADPNYCTKSNQPKVLSLDEGEFSFLELCKKYSGDVGYKSIFKELLELGIIEETSHQNIKLIKKDYLPKLGESTKLEILGTDVHQLISTIDHNMTCKPDSTFMQRKVYYDALPESVLPQLRRLSKSKGMKLLEYFDKLMRESDLDLSPQDHQPTKHEVSIGIYYFEQPTFKKDESI